MSVERLNWAESIVHTSAEANACRNTWIADAEMLNGTAEYPIRLQMIRDNEVRRIAAIEGRA